MLLQYRYIINLLTNTSEGIIQLKSSDTVTEIAANGVVTELVASISVFCTLIDIWRIRVITQLKEWLFVLLLKMACYSSTTMCQ